MSGPFDPGDRPRIYLNFSRMRPVGWRAWVGAIGFVAIALAVLALVAVVASTLFAIAIVVAVVAIISVFIGNLFRGRRRDVGPFRGNYDA